MTTQSEQSSNPSTIETEFLNLAYNLFYDLCDECFSPRGKSKRARFSAISRAFAIFSECLNYEPLKYYIEYIEKSRPPGDIQSIRFFEIVRHILIHFPFFTKWSEVHFSRNLILWNGKHSKIDKFLCDNEGKEGFKWRIWEPENKRMKYGYEIKFPKRYKDGSEIYLKDLIDEKKGMEICFRMMKEVLDSQVETVK